MRAPLAQRLSAADAPHTRIRRLRAAALGVLAAAWMAAACSASAAYRDLLPDLATPGWPSGPVPIGQQADFKDYYRIDHGCPLIVQGPGMLRLFVRAHAARADAPAESVSVIVAGLRGFAPQRWAFSLAPSRIASFGDGRLGFPTESAKISLAVPAGYQQLTVTGSSGYRNAVYALFAYDGPPTPETPPAEPVVETPPAPAPVEQTPGVTPPPSELAPQAEAQPTLPAVTGKPKVTAARRKAAWKLGATYMLGTIYDDNICRYSAQTLDEFRRGENPLQFAIETYDDVILDHLLQVEVARPLLLGKATAVRLGYERWQYLRNDIKTNEEFDVRLRQTLRRSDYVEGTFTYAPRNYVKELSDRPPFVSTSVPRQYLHFEVKRSALTLGYRWRARPWCSVRAVGGRTWRFYNRPFLENDLWEWSSRVALDLSLGRFSSTLQYSYADVAARGYDQVGETLENSDNDGDGSYEKDGYRLLVSYRPKTGRGWIGTRTAAVSLQLDYSRQFYTSQKPLYIDPGHVGRLDEAVQFQATWSSRPVWKQVTLEVGLRRTVRTAEGPGALIGEDPSEEKDYTGNRYWISMETPLR